jgi:iron complex transport system substrate-binding protein
LTGVPEKAAKLTEQLSARLAALCDRATERASRPRVYFEEWDDPMISGIRWVSELVEIAGGVDVFPHLAHGKGAKDRIVTGADVIAAAPDIVIGSWCGKKFVPAKFAARPGFDAIPAVRDGILREIKSPLILQPGPAALTDGVDAIVNIIDEWAGRRC